MTETGENQLQIAFVSTLWEGSTAMHRYDAMSSLGHRLIPLNYHANGPQSALMARARRFCFRVGIPGIDHPDPLRINEKIIEIARNSPIDILWLEKALPVRRDTILAVKDLIPACRIIGYANDDVVNPRNQSRQFLQQMPLYDAFFTTKSFNVDELKVLGCRNPIFVANSFNAHLHRPREIDEPTRLRLGGRVGFVGYYERARADSMLALAESGIPVRIWGPGWDRCRASHPLLTIERRGAYGEDYSLAISAFDINLCFLRQENRDRQTSRSVEIPACGAFMLGQRTQEHELLFSDRNEAVFFSDNQELVALARYYLDHDDERRSIGARGRERCLRDGYDNVSRIRSMLKQAVHSSHDLVSREH
jgi:spore maturation protein CgeB